jgi:hypothetical protein
MLTCTTGSTNSVAVENSTAYPAVNENKMYLQCDLWASGSKKCRRGLPLKLLLFLAYSFVDDLCLYPWFRRCVVRAPQMEWGVQDRKDCVSRMSI